MGPDRKKGIMNSVAERFIGESYSVYSGAEEEEHMKRVPSEEESLTQGKQKKGYTNLKRKGSRLAKPLYKSMKLFWMWGGVWGGGCVGEKRCFLVGFLQEKASVYQRGEKFLYKHKVLGEKRRIFNVAQEMYTKGAYEV